MQDPINDSTYFYGFVEKSGGSTAPVSACPQFYGGAFALAGNPYYSARAKLENTKDPSALASYNKCFWEMPNGAWFFDQNDPTKTYDYYYVCPD